MGLKEGTGERERLKYTARNENQVKEKEEKRKLNIQDGLLRERQLRELKSYETAVK